MISSGLLISRASAMTCWPSTTVDAGLLQLEEDRRLGDVDAQRHVADAVLGQDRLDLRDGALLQPDARMDRALQAGVAADRVRLVEQVRQLAAVRLGGRAEVEDPRAPGARQQRVALALVERPVADLRPGDVADVAGLEQQQGARRRTAPAPPASATAGTGGGARSRRAPPSRRPGCPARAWWRRGTRPTRFLPPCSVRPAYAARTDVNNGRARCNSLHVFAGEHAASRTARTAFTGRCGREYSQAS